MFGQGQPLIQKYQQALALSDMGFWEYCIKKNIVYWDEGFKKIFNIDTPENLGPSDFFLDKILPDDISIIEDAFKKINEPNFRLDIYFRILDKDNNIKHIHSRGHSITDEKGEVISIAGINWDVTNEFTILKERDQINAQARLLATLIDSSIDLFGYTDMSGVPLYANRAGQEIYGIDLDSKKVFSTYFAPAKKKQVTKAIITSLLDHGQWEGEVTLLNPKTGEEFPTWMEFFSVRLASNEIFFACSATNLSEVKAIQQSLIEQSKMASLGEMAGEIAHEINNPLMIIQGKSQLLQKEILDLGGNISNEKLINDLKKIELNSVRIDRIIKSLQRMTRKSNNDPFETVSILKLMDEVFEICKDRFEKFDIEFTIRIDEHINYSHLAKLRPTEITQVMVNLLNNAFDAVRNQQEKWINVHVREGSNSFIIEVVDSGQPIPPNIAEKMMDPFFTTKQTGQGTGLGLSLSTQIIKAHGSELFYDGKHPNTKFYFSVPKAN